MIIAIKNSKESYNCQDWAIVRRKEDSKTIAVIIRFPETTSRKEYQGTNYWDCFKIITDEEYYSEKKEYYNGKYPLGRRDGNDIGAIFKQTYISSFGNVYGKPVSVEIEWFSENRENLIKIIKYLNYKEDPFGYPWGRGRERMPLIEKDDLEPLKRGRDRLVQTEEDAPIEPGSQN